MSASPTALAHAALLRDNLDENGGGDLDFEAAAGSGVMIVADLQLCKFFRRRCLIVAERRRAVSD